MQTALLLAAGYGTRMRPLTLTTPKALLPLAGRTLLDRALDRFAEADIDRVVVNAHWQAAQIEAHLARRPPPPETIFAPEPVLLDTGGAVLAALARGDLSGDFFVANADSAWLDGPLPTLARMRRALNDDADGVLLLHRTVQIASETGLGDFFLDPWGIPRRRAGREVAPYLYAGLLLATPALFDDFTAGSAFSLNAVFERALARGRLRAAVHDGLWFHLSRPEDFAPAEHTISAMHVGASL